MVLFHQNGPPAKTPEIVISRKVVLKQKVSRGGSTNQLFEFVFDLASLRVLLGDLAAQSDPKEIKMTQK